MDNRTGHDAQPFDDHRDEEYRADAAVAPLRNEDDDWWLPTEEDANRPDAPFQYRPGEGPASHRSHDG